MTFTTAAGAYDQGKADIQSLSVDDQLGVLWFVYTEMGKSITPAVRVLPVPTSLRVCSIESKRCPTKNNYK